MFKAVKHTLWLDYNGIIKGRRVGHFGCLLFVCCQSDDSWRSPFASLELWPEANTPRSSRKVNSWLATDRVHDRVMNLGTKATSAVFERSQTTALKRVHCRSLETWRLWMNLYVVIIRWKRSGEAEKKRLLQVCWKWDWGSKCESNFKTRIIYSDDVHLSCGIVSRPQEDTPVVQLPLACSINMLLLLTQIPLSAYEESTSHGKCPVSEIRARVQNHKRRVR